ncbi:unnamed protein product [Lampetra fluviatilis]
MVVQTNHGLEADEGHVPERTSNVETERCNQLLCRRLLYRKAMQGKQMAPQAQTSLTRRERESDELYVTFLQSRCRKPPLLKTALPNPPLLLAAERGTALPAAVTHGAE